MAAIAIPQFNTLASATVTSGGTTTSGSDNALVVASAAAFTNGASSSASPPTQFDIVDAANDTEIMTVTNQSASGGVDWAVTRGAYGTTKTTHAANWTAVGVVSGNALTSVGLIIPASSGNGRLAFWSTTGSPTTGTWFAGDSVRDTNGMVWTCTASGTPGTWTSLTATAQAESDMRSISLDQFSPAAANVSLGGNREINVAVGILATDSPNMSQSNGWILDPNTWTETSATAFTVLGNQTATYVKGTKLTWTDTGGVKFGVVASSSYTSPSTTVTMMATSSYTLVSSPAPGAASYSYGNPTGFPTAFVWTPTVTGFSTAPTNPLCWWSVQNGLCTISVAWLTGGTSNATTFTITNLPIPHNATLYSVGTGTGVDNGTATYIEALILGPSAPSTVTLYKTQGATWTASGTKLAFFQMTYPI